MALTTGRTGRPALVVGRDRLLVDGALVVGCDGLLVDGARNAEGNAPPRIRRTVGSGECAPGHTREHGIRFQFLEVVVLHSSSSRSRSQWTDNGIRYGSRFHFPPEKMEVIHDMLRRGGDADAPHEVSENVEQAALALRELLDLREKLKVLHEVPALAKQYRVELDDCENKIQQLTAYLHGNQRTFVDVGTKIASVLLKAEVIEASKTIEEANVSDAGDSHVLANMLGVSTKASDEFQRAVDDLLNDVPMGDDEKKHRIEDLASDPAVLLAYNQNRLDLKLPEKAALRRAMLQALRRDR